MRTVIISETHTPERINKIYEFLSSGFLKENNVDNIVINGDLLGIFKIVGDYGYNYKEDKFIEKLDRKSLLNEIAPKSGPRLLQEVTKEGIIEYVKERYEWVYSIVEKFSKLKTTFFNMGDYESPVHFKVVDEIPFLLGINPEEFKPELTATDLIPIFTEFKDELIHLEKVSHFYYISLNSISVQQKSEKDPAKNIIYKIIGIPGISGQSRYFVAETKIQEKGIKEMLSKQNFNGDENLLIFDHSSRRIQKNPFKYSMLSEALNGFVNSISNKPGIKLFVHSHEGMATTHFYKKEGIYFILNNAGVNNSLFNMIEVTEDEVKCYDVDPTINKFVQLSVYDFASVPMNPEHRLSFNYPNYLNVIIHRNLQGSEKM